MSQFWRWDPEPGSLCPHTLQRAQGGRAQGPPHKGAVPPRAPLQPHPTPWHPRAHLQCPCPGRGIRTDGQRAGPSYPSFWLCPGESLYLSCERSKVSVVTTDPRSLEMVFKAKRRTSVSGCHSSLRTHVHLQALTPSRSIPRFIVRLPQSTRQGIHFPGALGPRSRGRCPQLLPRSGQNHASVTAGSFTERLTQETPT